MFFEDNSTSGALFRQLAADSKAVLPSAATAMALPTAAMAIGYLLKPNGSTLHVQVQAALSGHLMAVETSMAFNLLRSQMGPT